MGLFRRCGVLALRAVTCWGIVRVRLSARRAGGCACGSAGAGLRRVLGSCAVVTVLAPVVVATEAAAQSDPVTVSFGSSMYSVSEGASVAVELSEPRNSDATVQITAAGSASEREGSGEVDLDSLDALDVSVREGSGEVDLDWLDDLDVVWDSPSADEFGSMPLGNGDIGLNVWVVDDGDLLFYISKTDTWNEFSSLFKLGRVRVKFDPNPFAGRASFEQALVLRNGEITIESTKTDNFEVDLKIWVDANNPVIRVEGTSSADMDVTVDLEMWRTERRELDQYITYDSNGRRTKHPDNYREPYEYWYDDDTTVVLEPDTVVSGLTDRIVWYHRNGYSKFDERLGELSQSDRGGDPLMHRTFGAAILGLGLTRNSSDQSLISQDTTTVDISIFPLTMQPATVEEWRSGLDSSISAVESSSKSARYDAHKRWWQEFWGRHRISVSSDESPAERSSALVVSRAYALQRFMNAAAGRGAQPIKFNGSIFTVDVVNNLPAFFNTYRAGYFDPDFRAWGASHWYQNVRFPYLTMLMGGDYEFMQPFFDMYTEASSSWTSHVKGTYLHDGFVLPELMNSWGGGIATSNSINGLVEISAIMLDFYQFTQDQAFFDTVLLPFVNGMLTYYDQHWSRSSTGDIRIVSSALEQERGAVNPTSDLAGLHVVVDKMVALPDELTSEADRALWVRMKKDLPNIATFVRNGQEIVAIAERPHRSASRGENPDLYAVWPFRVYSVGKPDLDLAVATYNQRAATGVTGWQQDPAQAAMLGMTNEAKRHLLTYVTKEEPNRGNRESFRFPGFFGPAQDWFPVQTQPSIAMSTLQNMLVQYEDHRILMFPAWPQEWDADFKVHLPYGTTIEGVLKDGVVESLTVTPEHRTADLEFVQFDPDPPVVDISAPVDLTTERVEAEDYKDQMGLQIESTTDVGGGQSIGYANVNDYLVYPARDLSDVGSVSLRVASNRGVNARAELRSGSTTGAVIASFEVNHTGGWQSFITVTEDIVDPGEQLDLYLVFTAWGFNLNWIEFTTDPSSGASNVDYDSDGDGLIEVSTLAQLDAIRWDLDGDGNSLNSGYADAFSGAAANMGCPSGGCSGYELSAVLDFDTDASGSVDRLDGFWNSGLGWEPIGTYDRPFRAVFDGNGHDISNLFIDRTTDNVGLFGYVADSALLADVKMTGAAVTTRGRFAGVLAGTSLGAIVTSSADGEVSATGYAGVLAGANRGGRIQASHAAGEAAAYGYVGGLVGLNSGGGAVEASYSTARVLQRGTPDNRATTQIGNDGAGHTGGLIGKTLDNATATDSYWDTQTSTQATSDGGTAKTTTELASPTDYSGIYENWNLDFDLDNTDDDPWNFGTASDLPTLKHATVPATPLTVAFPTGTYTVTEGAKIKIELELSKDPDATFTVPLTVTAQDGTTASDYTVTPTSVVFNDGETSKNITLTATDDTVSEESESVLLRLGTLPTGLSAGPRNTITVSIVDDDTAVWSVTAEPVRVVEGAVSTITVSVDRAFDTDQTIMLAATGTAASEDYSLSSSSLTLDAGDMSVTASVTAVDDSDEESDETVVVTASHGGETVGSATVTIEDNDTPTWSVTAVPARVVEGAESTITVSVDKAFDTDQTITLAATGTAASEDYSLSSSSSLTLDAGDMSVTATVTAVDDGVIEGGDETVVVTASHGGETVGSATVTIEDNDTPTWSVTAEPARVVEGAESTITVSSDKTFDTDQTITLAATGTAAGSDYSLSSSSLTLHAGDMSVTATVTAVDDSVIEGGDETVVVTASHSGDAVGSATVTIVDNDTPTWSVTAEPARVAEGAGSTITVSAGKAFAVDQTITLAATGTAANSDYSLSSSSLTLHAGDTSVTATVTAVDDSVIEGGDETVVVTASHSSDAVGSATVTIVDNDTPTWSVTAEPVRVVEGAESTITVSVDKAFAVDQTITLAATGTAASEDYSLSSSSLTLDAGDTSVTATVTAVDDNDEESDETVVVTASHDGAVGSATVTIEANDTPVSTDAALSSLALSGVSVGVFGAGTTAYAASVGNGVSSTTVTAVASDDGASVVIADGDGETQGTSRSVSLVVGDNEITVTVTAEDGSTTKTYTITVARAVAPLPPGVVWGDRLPDRDIALPGAGSSSGVWSDGTDVWVLTTAGKISVYSLADGAEHTDRGFTLPGGAEYAAGLWSDGATLWVADVNSGWVRAYRLSDGARQADRDLDTAGNTEPAGIWSDDTTMWVADFTDSRVYAYDLTTKARVADKELDLDKNPGETYNPFGIWSNGDTLLAASWFGSEIIAHSLADGQRQPAKDLSTFASRTNSPNGIWSNGHILWVVDSSDATLYAYAVPGLGAPPNDTPTWSVTAEPVRVVEGVVSTITVSVDKTFDTAQTITLAAGGTAAGSDYSLLSSLTLDAGDTSVTASVTAVDDSVIEGGDETVVVTASHGGETVGSATVTIVDNDTPTWSVTAEPVRVVEGVVSTITVSVDKAFDTDQTIMLAVAGTAASGDYSLLSSLTLDAGDMSVTASVTAVDDSVIEGGDETVVVTASHSGDAVGSATVTIEDNDTPTWSVTAEPVRVAEGAGSTITVSAGKAFAVDQTITLAATGTAANSDYSLSSSSLTLHAGDTSVTATVTAVDDSVIEGGDETVVVTASHSSGAVGSATVTIVDNDTPTWSVTAEPVRVVEGAESTITVSVDKAFAVDQTITLAATGTAASEDYSLSSSSLTLDAGDMSVTATVTAVDDSDEENDETVVVTASHGGAVGSATVTIVDNDTPTWSVTAEPVRVVEGVVSTITVSVDKTFDTAQTITLAAGGTAAGSDYSLLSSLTLDAGDTSVTASVTAVDDSVIEGGDETVVVTASHGGETVGSATVTIVDNDTPTWSVTAEPVRVVEGVVSTITVSVDKAFDTDQTIMLAVAGTAASGDYSLLSSLTLDAGDMSVTASVTAVDDSVIEGGDETVVVTASHSGDAVGSATVTIEDNDTPTWSVTAEPVRVAEGAGSTITVSAGKAFAVDQTITLAATGTAANSDYSLSSSSLTLHAGDTSVTATVTAVDDSVIEGGDETVVVTASHSSGAVGSATVTIVDNDTPTWSVTAEPVRVVEGAESTITVSVDKAFAVDQTITLAATGTAASEDYSLSSSSLTLDAGDTSVTATVTAVDDSDEENDETVVVTASHGDAVGSATVTIEANDTPVSTDAALSSLALSGVSIGVFGAGTTAYAASVGNGVSSTTVTAVASDDGASVVIADGDGETQGTSRSVSLVVGDNEITVTVTAEDGSTTKTYTITVARAVAPLPPGVVWGDRLPDRDIALPGAGSSSGVWSDGTDVWVVTTAGKISVYSLADGAEHTDRGFTLPGGAEYAAGLWSNGATLWVADVNRGWVRAYRLSDGARQADRDLDTAALAAAGNTEPAGIWSNDTTMWVADFTDSRVYAYDLTTKARVADKELDLDKNPGETYNPFGIWSNGDTLLAASWFGGEIIAHSLADGQRQPAKDLSTFASRTNFPNGIWSNGHILWVVDSSDATLYAYAVPGLDTPG